MKKTLWLSAAFSALLLFPGCQKEAADPSSAPEAIIEQTTNTGVCKHVTDRIYDPSLQKFVDVYCNLRTCSNPFHEICPVCGIGRRPPKGCICGTGTSPQPDPDDPNVPPLTQRKDITDLSREDYFVGNISGNGQAEAVQIVRNYGCLYSPSLIPGTGFELMEIATTNIMYGYPIIGVAEYYKSGIRYEQDIVITGQFWSTNGHISLTYMDCGTNSAHTGCDTERNVLYLDNYDVPATSILGGYSPARAATYKLIGVRNTYK